MTDNRRAEWLSEIRSAAKVINGETQTNEDAARWQRHAVRPLPVVTIYGPYDSGKSTLLKRLLVEDGTPVPPWLRISARRETFDVNEIDTGGLTYRDTPGISAGNAQTDSIANNTLATTDALMLVLPPQLLTTGREHVLSIMNGEFYGTPGSDLFPDGALLLVIAQSDTAGADPLDDPSAFHDMCQRKREELERLIKQGAGNRRMRPPQIYVVSADAYGLTATSRQPQAGDYADQTGWDGIPNLRATLHGLTARRDAFRLAAEVRYWSLLARRALAVATDDLKRVEAATDELRRGRDHLAALEEQLDALDRAAAFDLRSLVNQELRSIADAAPAQDFTNVQSQATQRLAFAAATWTSRWGFQLDQLARNGEAELTARARRPGAAWVDSYLDDLLRDATAAKTGSGQASAQKIIAHASLWEPRIGYEAFRAHTGMSAAQARAELAHFKSLRGADLTRYFSDGTGFMGAEQASDVEKHLKQLELAEVVPLVIQLGTLIWAEASQRHVEQQERQRRAKLSAEIEDAAGKISAQILDGGAQPANGQEVAYGWKAAIREFRELLYKRRPPDELLESMQDHQDKLIAAINTLAGLLDQA